MARKKTTKKKVTKLTEGKTRSNVKKKTTSKRPVKAPPAPTPQNFVEVEGGLLIPEQPAGPDPETASIEELETPDQLEERDISKEMGETLLEKVEKAMHEVPKPKEEVPADLYPVVKKLKDKHPDWEPKAEFQIKMFQDMHALNIAETEMLRAKMDELEILLEQYPLIASQSDLDELRKLMMRNVHLEHERQIIVGNIQVRINHINAQNQPEPEPEKKGFFKRLFS